MELTVMEYEARRRRSTWSDSVLCDVEVKALDEANGEWILCATCAAHFQRTGRGRRPNDPLGFKVKMNGRFQEAAWIMHKSRVVAHRIGVAHTPANKRRRVGDAGEDDHHETGADTDNASDNAPLQAGDDGVSLLMDDFSSTRMLPPNYSSESGIHIPLSGWRCPGIVPNAFYHTHSDLVHAFAKFYVGSYRINVVRDIRTDRVLLFSHECENQVVHRGRHLQSLACNQCHPVWTQNKSFRRILKKMHRYNQVEDVLRRAWSLSAADLEMLSRFKHASSSNLNVEGRKLKQAAIEVLRHYGTPQSTAQTVDVFVAATNASGIRSSTNGYSPQPAHSEPCLNQDVATGAASPAESDVAPMAEPYHDATTQIR